MRLDDPLEGLRGSTIGRVAHSQAVWDRYDGAPSIGDVEGDLLQELKGAWRLPWWT